MTDKAVLNFLKEHNRPFSLNDIIKSMGENVSKSSVQKTVDKLVQKEKVIEKTYNKQRIYCIAQDDQDDPSKAEEELKSFDREINTLDSNVRSLKEKLDEGNEVLKSHNNGLTLEEAKRESTRLEEQVEVLQGKLEELEGKAVPISDEERMKIINEYENYVKEYRKRKRLCLNIIDAIMEGYPKTKKDLFEEVGMETDEDYGFKLE